MSDGGPSTRSILRFLGFGFVALVLATWLAQTLFPTPLRRSRAASSRERARISAIVCRSSRCADGR